MDTEPLISLERTTPKQLKKCMINIAKQARGWVKRGQRKRYSKLNKQTKKTQTKKY